MSKRRKNPRKRPTRTRRGRAMAAEKRRARAFWAMRAERRTREPAEPPEPAWFKVARIWAAALLAGYFAWTVVKWIMD